MIKNLRRRGQAVIEFAMILPIFALLLFASVYMGMFVLDYVTLDAAAAYAARDAVTNGGTVSDGVRKKIKSTTLYLEKMYKIKDNDSMDDTSDLRLQSKTETVDGVEFYTVLIKMEKRTTNKVLDLILPGDVVVKKSAYKGAGG